MLYRFSLAILFGLFGQVCALEENVYTFENESPYMINVVESQNVEDLMAYDENDLSYEEDLSEDDGVKMNYEMPPLHRQYKGSMDQYYKEFEM